MSVLRLSGVLALLVIGLGGSATAQSVLDAPIRAEPAQGLDIVHVEASIRVNAEESAMEIQAVTRAVAGSSGETWFLDVKSRGLGIDSLSWSLGRFHQAWFSPPDSLLDAQARASAPTEVAPDATDASDASDASDTTDASDATDASGSGAEGVRTDSLSWAARRLPDGVLRLAWLAPWRADTLTVRVAYRLIAGEGLTSTAETDGCCLWTDSGAGESWLPLEGGSADRFTASVDIRHPRNWNVASGGSIRSVGPGRTEIAMSAPMTADHFPLVLGPMRVARRGDVSLHFNVGDPSRFLEIIADDLARLRDRPDVVTNGDSVRIAAVDLSGARPLVGPNFLVVDQSLLADPRTAATTATDFEIARAASMLWTDGLFVARPWTDIWLTEALSCRMAAELLEERDGPDAGLRAWADLAEAYRAESRRYQRPLTWDRWAVPSDLLDAHACGKGAWTLRYLESLIGRGPFERALRRLMEASVAGTDRLQNVLEAVSGRTLGPEFDALVFAAGHPSIGVTTRFASASGELSVRIDQTQSGPLVPAVIPLETTFRSVSIEGAFERPIRLDTGSDALSLPMSIPPRYVQMDADGVLLADVAYAQDGSAWAALLREGSPWERLRAAEAIARYVEDPSAALAVRLLLQSEPLAQIRERLVAAVARGGHAPGPRRLLAQRLRDDDARVRVAAVRALAGWPYDATSSAALLEAVARDSVYAVQAAIVDALYATGAPEALSVARSALITPSEGDIVRASGMRVLAGLADQAERKRAFLEHSRPTLGTSRIEAGLVGLQNLEADRDIERRIWELLESDDFRIRNAAAATAAPLLSGSDAPRVKTMAEREPYPRVRRSLSRLAIALEDRDR